MHNAFITRYFDWGAGGSTKVRLVNSALRALGKRTRLRAPNSTGHMTTVEQRMNVYHLVSQVLAYGVPGDLVEVGSYAGESALLIANVMRGEGGDGRTLHLYDAFEAKIGTRDPIDVLRESFCAHALPVPAVHAGWYSETMPRALPSQIAFAHIDCGVSGDPALHERTLLHVMEHVYPRLARGAVCSVVDYCDQAVLPDTLDVQPGVRPAFDTFLADKPESISVLYAHEFGHAYFRKL